MPLDLRKQVDKSKLQAGLGHVVPFEPRHPLDEIIQAIQRLFQDRRGQKLTDHMESRSDRFIAVERLLLRHHFAPAPQTAGLEADEEDQSRVYAAEAGLERFAEGQANQPQNDLLQAQRPVAHLQGQTSTSGILVHLGLNNNTSGRMTATNAATFSVHLDIMQRSVIYTCRYHGWALRIRAGSFGEV